MHELSLYGFTARWLGLLNHRLKIALALLPTLVPLIALATRLVLYSLHGRPAHLATTGVALAATLIGIALTIAALRRIRGADRAAGDRRDVPIDLIGTPAAEVSETVGSREAIPAARVPVDETAGRSNRQTRPSVLTYRIAEQQPFAPRAFPGLDYRRLVDALQLGTAVKAVAGAPVHMAAMPGEANGSRSGAPGFIRFAGEGAARSGSALAPRRADMADRAAGSVALRDLAMAPAAPYGGDAARRIGDTLAAARLAAEPPRVNFHPPPARQGGARPIAAAARASPEGRDASCRTLRQRSFNGPPERSSCRPAILSAPPGPAAQIDPETARAFHYLPDNSLISSPRRA